MLESPDGIVRSIRIYPIESKPSLPWEGGDYRYELSISAWKRVDGKAQDWYRMHKRLGKLPGKEGELLEVLEKGWVRLERLTERDLKPVPSLNQ